MKNEILISSLRQDIGLPEEEVDLRASRVPSRLKSAFRKDDADGCLKLLTDGFRINSWHNASKSSGIVERNSRSLELCSRTKCDVF